MKKYVDSGSIVPVEHKEEFETLMGSMGDERQQFLIKLVQLSLSAKDGNQEASDALEAELSILDNARNHSPLGDKTKFAMNFVKKLKMGTDEYYRSMMGSDFPPSLPRDDFEDEVEAQHENRKRKLAEDLDLQDIVAKSLNTALLASMPTNMFSSNFIQEIVKVGTGIGVDLISDRMVKREGRPSPSASAEAGTLLQEGVTTSATK